MVKFSDNGHEVELSRGVAAYMKTANWTGKVLTMQDIDAAMAAKAPSGSVDSELRKLKEEYSVHMAELAGAAVEETKVEEPKAETVEEPKAETESKLAQTSFFNDTKPVEEATTGEGGKPKAPAKVKTKEEKEAEERKRQEEVDNAIASIKHETDLIVEIQKKYSELDYVEEFDNMMSEAVKVDGYWPLYSTFVSNDTRPRPVLKDQVKPKDRTLAPEFQREANDYKGKTIPLAKSAAQFEITWEESIPPQPKGFFVLVPDYLYEVEPEKYALRDVKVKALEAHKANEGKPKNLVPKYFTKQQMLAMLILTDSSLKVYDPVNRKYRDNSPVIRYVTPKSTQSNNSDTVPFVLRAVLGEAQTKLSIRHFLPEKVHVRGPVTQETLADLTYAYFYRALWFNPRQFEETKYDKLRDHEKKMFAFDEMTGKWSYLGFDKVDEIKAYDSPRNAPKPIKIPAEFPQVELTQGDTPRFKFLKIIENQEQAPAQYLEKLQFVGEEINNAKRVVSLDSRVASVEDTRAKLQARINIHQGDLSLILRAK